MTLFQKVITDSSRETSWNQPFVGALVKAGRLKNAADAAAIIKSDLVKPYALAMVAEAYGKAGDNRTAVQLLQQALGVEPGGSSY
ncbi:MAG TPA: hypothetical protein VJ746_04955 [Nitrospira sp.]|nr:hypothetical protein [Nitrospira sp.]